MIKRKLFSMFVVTLVSVLLIALLSGCGKSADPSETPIPETNNESVIIIKPSEQPPVETGMMNPFSAVSASESLIIPGTWQTASVEYADDGTMAPEYYVRFTDSEILYGHLKDGQFVLDHSDKIVSFSETISGGCKVQAEAANGVQYTYQTCESDDTVLEYYETWQEDSFSEMYRGGASLSRCMQ